MEIDRSIPTLTPKTNGVSLPAGPRVSEASLATLSAIVAPAPGVIRSEVRPVLDRGVAAPVSTLPDLIPLMRHPITQPAMRAAADEAADLRQMLLDAAEDPESFEPKTFSARMTYLQATLRKEMQDSADNRLRAMEKLITEMLEALEESASAAVKKMADDLEQAERIRNALSWFAKILGWVVAAITIAATILTGGSALAVALPLLLMLFATLDSELGLGVMDAIMGPLMKALMPVIEWLAREVFTPLATLALGAFLSKEDAALYGEIVGMVIAAIAVVVAPLILAKAGKALQNLLSGVLDTLLPKAMVETVKQMVRTIADVIRPMIEKLMAVVGKGKAAINGVLGQFAEMVKKTLPDSLVHLVTALREALHKFVASPDVLQAWLGRISATAGITRHGVTTAAGVHDGVMTDKIKSQQASVNDVRAVQDTLESLQNYLLEWSDQTYRFFKEMGDARASTAAGVARHIRL